MAPCFVLGWGEGLAKWVIRPDGSKEARWTGVLRTVPDLLDQPLRWRKPRRIFVNSMSDLFHEEVPDGFIDRVLTVIKRCEVMNRGHVFQLLTKRPERMRDFLTGVYGPFPTPMRNLWLGVSVEDQAAADERIPLLLQTPAAVRWISAEPLLGPIRLKPWIDKNLSAVLDWIVIGAESGQNPRPMAMEDARGIIVQAQNAGVATFVKQDNGPRPGMQGRFTDEEWRLKEYPA